MPDLPRGRVLLGAFPTAEAAVAFAGHVGVTPATEVARLWSRTREAFLANGDGVLRPSETNDDPATREALEEALQAPRFRSWVEGRSWRIASVDVASLVTSQPLVHLTRVDALVRRLSEEGLLPILFPRRTSVDASVEAPGGAAIALLTERADHAVSKIEARQADPTGAIEVVFRLDPRPNYLTVQRFGSSLVVRNGNHRLVAAWGRGIRRVPCVMIEGDGETWADRPDRFTPDVLQGRHMPRVVDLAEPSAACVDIDLQTRRFVMLFRAEQHWSSPG